MQFLTTLAPLLLLLTTSATASPTPILSSKRACTTVYPTLQVPVDSSAPTRVYGSSSAVTLWKNPSGNRNMLFNFAIPTSASGSTCNLKFHAVANPPMSISGPVDINAYLLSSTVVSATSWNSKPARVGLSGAANLVVSSTAATEITVVTQGCITGSVNYELEVPTTASLAFDSDNSNGFYMTYGC